MWKEHRNILYFLHLLTEMFNLEKKTSVSQALC